MQIDPEMLNCFCDEANDLLQRWEAICFSLARDEDSKLYQELFRIAHNLKGGSRSVGLIAYGDLVHKIEDGITLLRDEKLKISNEALALLLEAQSCLYNWTLNLRTNDAHNPEVEDFKDRYQRVFNENQRNDIVQSVTNISKTSTQERHKEPEAFKAAHLQEPVNPLAASSRNPRSETIRISAEKLDSIIQVIGELSIHQSIVWHTKSTSAGPSNSSKLFLNSLQLSQKLTKELYDKALSLRMQPIQSVFQRLERNLVDLSRTLNKDVAIHIDGGDVELDKAVIEKIVDPLTHIVRNAIDHGIESLEERERSKKPRKGNISVSAKQDAFGVEILVQDDGKGLNSERIRQKAIEKGLIEASNNITASDVYNLIMLPGFSTAERVTDVSGRGVGLDVVKKSLEELNGNMRIESEMGKGTSFCITLPTSVSIIDVLLIQVGAQNYVVPISFVDEVVILDNPASTNQEMMTHNKQVLPLRDLELLMGRRRSSKVNDSSHPRNTLLICKTKTSKIGLIVDKVLGQQQVVIRSLNENINGSFGILGGTILGNGEPGLILNIPQLLEHHLSENHSRRTAA